MIAMNAGKDAVGIAAEIDPGISEDAIDLSSDSDVGGQISDSDVEGQSSIQATGELADTRSSCRNDECARNITSTSSMSFNINTHRCLANIWNKGVVERCSRRRSVGKHFCLPHQATFDANGCLPHGPRIVRQLPLERSAVVAESMMESEEEQREASPSTESEEEERESEEGQRECPEKTPSHLMTPPRHPKKAPSYLMTPPKRPMKSPSLLDSPPKRPKKAPFLLDSPPEAKCSRAVVPGNLASPVDIGPAKVAVDLDFPADFPEEMRGLDSRIISMLCTSPRLVTLLRKYPSIWSGNISGNLAGLAGFLQMSKKSERPVSATQDAGLRTITISKLPLQASQGDVEALFDNEEPVEVFMPVESRNKRHVGIAYALFSSPEAAHQAARHIDGYAFSVMADSSATTTRIRAVPCRMHGTQEAEARDKMQEEEGGTFCSNAVRWRSACDLFDLHRYSRDLSVEDGCELHASMPVGVLPGLSLAEARSTFQEAARREREEQMQLFRNLNQVVF